jgi:hypothetical protein
METEQTRNVSAILSLVILVFVLLGGVTVYLMRDKIFPPAAGESGVREMSAQEAKSLFLSGVSTLASGDCEGAKIEFQRIATGMPEPLKSWTNLNFALASLLLGETQPALDVLSQLNKKGLYSTASADAALANFFVEVSRTLLEKKPVPASIRNLYDAKQDVFALLLFAIWDWEAKSSFSDAGMLLATFQRRVGAGTWEANYKPLAEKYLADWKLLEPIEKGLPQATSPDAATTLLKALRNARSQAQTGTKVNERMDTIEKALLAKGAKP